MHPENIAGKPAKRINPPQPQPLPPPPCEAPRPAGPIPAIYQDLLTNDPPRRIWYTPGSWSPVEPPTPSPSRSPSPAPSPFNIVKCDLPVLPGTNRDLPSIKPPLAQRKLNYTHPYRRPFSPSTSARNQPCPTSIRLTYAHEARVKLPAAKPVHKVAVPALRAQGQNTRVYLIPSIRRFHSSPSYFNATRRFDTRESSTSASTVNDGDEGDITELDTPGAREISSWIPPPPSKEGSASSDPNSEDDTPTIRSRPPRLGL